MKLDKNKFVTGRAASILAPAALAMVVTGCGGGGSSSGGGAPAPQDPVGYQYPQDMPADVAQKEIACGGEGAIELDANNLTDSAKIAFLDAQDGDVIVFPEGTFKLQDTLTLDGELSGNRVADVTICGQGHG